MLTEKNKRKGGLIAWFLMNEYVRSIRQEFVFTDPDRVRDDNLLYQIEAAQNRGQLAVGITEAWRAMHRKKVKLLVAERDYLFPAIYKRHNKRVVLDMMNNNGLPLSDAVDAAVEQVIQSGGGIEFVENGRLGKYHHLVIIQQD